jgi:hypothetical protein
MSGPGLCSSTPQGRKRRYQSGVGVAASRNTERRLSHPAVSVSPPTDIGGPSTVVMSRAQCTTSPGPAIGLRPRRLGGGAANRGSEICGCCVTENAPGGAYCRILSGLEYFASARSTGRRCHRRCAAEARLVALGQSSLNLVCVYFFGAYDPKFTHKRKWVLLGAGRGGEFVDCEGPNSLVFAHVVVKRHAEDTASSPAVDSTSNDNDEPDDGKHSTSGNS